MVRLIRKNFQHVYKYTCMYKLLRKICHSVELLILTDCMQQFFFSNRFKVFQPSEFWQMLF
jgi:hypothetical protein